LYCCNRSYNLSPEQYLNAQPVYSLFHNVLTYLCFGKMGMCSKCLMHYPQYNIIRLKTSAIILSFKTVVQFYSQS
jgi:hypothetical protein